MILWIFCIGGGGAGEEINIFLKYIFYFFIAGVAGWTDPEETKKCFKYIESRFLFSLYLFVDQIQKLEPRLNWLVLILNSFFYFLLGF